MLKYSLIEMNARERAKAILDEGTFREILGPFDRLESPHLASQGIVPQSDDGVVVARGRIGGESAVVISIEGEFQGGGIGEVSGSKIAGALELALRDCEKGINTRPVLLLDTGGIRLQEGNYGLLAIAEIGSAIVSLRRYTPVVGIIPGMIGCYGGMSICAGLCSYLIMTKQGRLQLNGSEVIEQEAGISEFNSSDRRRVWETVGGGQRTSTGFADVLVEDDLSCIQETVKQLFQRGIPSKYRSSNVSLYRSLLASIDPSEPMNAALFREWWENRNQWVCLEPKQHEVDKEGGTSRGKIWFQALTDHSYSKNEVPSVLCADSMCGGERVRFISVVPNPNHRFPRARQGEIGLDEGWAIAHYIWEIMEEDRDGNRRAIVAIVDVPSQAYGYQEELLGINLACAAAVDAYASARLAGHPVITLIVGNAISGAFLAHGMQSNRLLALDDTGVMVQVMSKKSAARITRRTISELDEAAKKVPATAYDVRSFATLGALDELIGGINADTPDGKDIQFIQSKLVNAIAVARMGERDLTRRLTSLEARRNRSASIRVRKLLKEQWN